MRNKSKLIVSLFLSFLIIFSNISFVYAENEAETTDTTDIKQVETNIEEPQVEEPQIEEQQVEAQTAELQVEEQKTEPKETKKVQTTYPIKITWHIKYRDANGEWTEFVSTSTSKITDNTKTVKPPFSVLQNKVVKGELYNEAEDKTYVFNTKYTDDYGNSYVTLSKAVAASVDHEEDASVKIRVGESTDIYFTADYREKKPVHNMKGIYSDEIGHTTGSWGTVNNTATITYSHTFKNAADVPTNYRFVYWKNYEDGDIMEAGEKKTWDLTELSGDTEVTYKATYQPIITINYYSEDGTLLGSVTDESIDIYESGSQFKNRGKFLGWYEDGALVEKGTVRKLDLTTVKVQTDFDVYAKYEKDPEPTPEPTPDKPKPKPPVNPTVEPDEPAVETPTPTPTPTPTTTIKPTPAPQSAPTGSWALINLIATILSCLCAIALIFVKKDTEDDEPTDDEKKDMRKMVATKIASIIVGIGTIIAFILTEDMSLPMAYTDKWTFLMILLLIIEIVNIFIIRRQSKGEEDDDNN